MAKVDSYKEILKDLPETWSGRDLLEKRAVVAAVCEPKLLKDRETVSRVLNLLDRITEDLLNVINRKDDNFKILRKTLGYFVPAESRVTSEFRWKHGFATSP